MRRQQAFISSSVIVLLLIFPLRIALSKNPATATKLNVNARSAVLMEVTTGTILFEQNPNEPLEPASLTKILTLYLVFEGLREGIVHLNDPVWISERAWRTGGSRMFLDVDTQVPLEEIIKGIAVASGNDACVAIAEHMGGTVEAFVDAMNRKARALGLNHSHFLNPHGLPARGQQTTARDIAILASAYIKRFPEALRYHSMKSYTFNNITQPNRNHLLSKDPTVDGLKTGYVAAAGYHLVATAKRNGMRLLAVIMGASSSRIRESEAEKLLNYGFRHFVLVEPVTPNYPTVTLRLWEGNANYCKLHPMRSEKFVIPVEEKGSYRVRVNAPTDLTAPIKKNQPLGTVEILRADQVVATVPLVSSAEIAKAGLPKRIWHYLVRLYLFRPHVIGLAAIALLGIFFFLRRRSRRRRPKTFFRRR